MLVSIPTKMRFRVMSSKADRVTVQPTRKLLFVAGVVCSRRDKQIFGLLLSEITLWVFWGNLAGR